MGRTSMVFIIKWGKMAHVVFCFPTLVFMKKAGAHGCSRLSPCIESTSPALFLFGLHLLLVPVCV